MFHDDQGYRRLALAVIRRAVLDLGNRETRRSAQSFLLGRSKIARFWMDVAGVSSRDTSRACAVRLAEIRAGRR